MNEQEYIDMFTNQEESDSEEYEYFLEEICSENYLDPDPDPDFDFMMEQLIDYAKKTAEELKKESNNKRRNFNTAAIAYDIRTGQTYFGRNGFVEEKVHDILKQLGPETTINGLKLGNCAEMEAVTKALNAGARLEDIKLLVIEAKEKGFGTLNPLCENCDYTLNNWSLGPRIKETYSGTSDNWEWGFVKFRKTPKTKMVPRKR